MADDKPSRRKAPPTLTTEQRLGAVIKSARDIMRKDRGLSGELDRLPMLTWVMLLKFLDDLEQERELEAGFSAPYKPIVRAPYRWRDWAVATSDFARKLSGDDFMAFINQEKVTLPDKTVGPGLFAYLRTLDEGEGRVVATVFRGLTNRMASAALLKDVLAEVDKIHFCDRRESQPLGSLYESLLKEMRDAAGDSGEFYTPRPVVNFMVKVTDPRLGEVVLDPACGTGGFLAAVYEHLNVQATTVAKQATLQSGVIRGGEAKPLPYLLALMNLLLHGLKNPAIEHGNSLARKLTDITDADRVDVVLTNPPFGGEEEASIKRNFPEDKQTQETALLFLQMIMRRLRRTPKGGRAAVVVPNGTLFADGIAARIKADLLNDFDLHTVVRLPNGVFAPYTDIPSNLLFFTRGGPTKSIWYYEIPAPEGRKKYSKTAPMRDDDFAACLAWWSDRKESERAWQVPVEGLVRTEEKNGAKVVVACNLDVKNPSSLVQTEAQTPEALLAGIVEKEERILAILRELRASLGEGAPKRASADA